MVGAGGDFTLASCADDVTGAVLISTEEGSSALNLLWLTGLGGIEGGIRSARIARHATNCNELLVIVGTVPVAGPLPHVTRHVIKAISVGRILRHGGDTRIAIIASTAVREVSLMCVGHLLAIWAKRLILDERLAGKIVVCRKLLFCLCGQPLARPLRIGFCIGISNMYNWVVLFGTGIAL